MLKVFENIHDLQLELLNNTGYNIGFVPTMGALHKGHLSLIEASAAENDINVVSIFVNPRQFNDANDLKKYPRDLQSDLKILEQTACNIVFCPAVEEIYPNEKEEFFDFGQLEEVMEGKYRPGHFNGVAQVVSRLFRIVNPTNAYFGLKDFQQVAIIKKMTHMLDMQVNIVECPIIREEDGLAMSSRNVLLTDENRRNAAQISQTILKAVGLKENKSIDEVKKWVIKTINSIPLFEVEYFEIVNANELTGVSSWDSGEPLRGCIAVKAGNVRLIDNVAFN